MKPIPIVLLLTLFIAPTSPLVKAGESDTGPGGVLLLKSGFGEGVAITADMARLTGSDVPGFAWENTPSWESSRVVYIIGPGRKVTDFMETVIEKQIGPKGKETNVLRLINKADDPEHSSTSRNEFSFFAASGPNEYTEGYVRYWMKLQDNLNRLIPADKPSPWYMIMEWKEPNSRTAKSAQECRECCNARAGGSNNYRINVGLQRSAGAGEFHWIIRGEQPQPCRQEEWRYENFRVRVPLGEWFFVEAYMKKHPREGRVYFAVNNQVVLDTNEVRPAGFTGRTEHANNPLPLRFWSPMKNYHGMEWNVQGPVSQWYDDFELWSGFPPGHAVWQERAKDH
jgi:hypothetical protein